MYLPRLGFLGGTSGKEPPCQRRRHKTQVQSLDREDSPGGGYGNALPTFLPGTSHGQRSLVGYSPWGHKESDTTEATEHAGRLESETAGTLPDASSQKHIPAQNKQGVGVVAPDTA